MQLAQYCGISKKESEACDTYFDIIVKSMQICLNFLLFRLLKVFLCMEYNN